MRKIIAQITFLLTDLLMILSIAVFWFQSSAESIRQGFAMELVAYGRLCGLFAWYLALKQILYIGRVQWLQMPFGFASLANLHKRNGILVYLLIGLHILLLTVGLSIKYERSFLVQIFSFLNYSEDFIIAALGFLLLTGVVLVTLLKKRFKYETWYYLHLTVYLTLILSWEHPLEFGHDFEKNALFKNIWIILTVFCLINIVAYRFLLPLLTYWRQKFTVSRIVQENDDVWSIYISGQAINRLRIEAGQFIVVRFLQKNLWKEAHPFSVSALPSTKELRITVKALGDFTNNVSQIPVGTKVLIEGPHGDFTYQRASGKKVLLLAGGIGITPLRSIAEALLKQGREVVLFYSHRYERDGVFIAELDALKEQGLKVFHVISRGDINIGEQGRINKERLRRLVNNVEDYETFICGPVSMMSDCHAIVRSLGVPRKKIYAERFIY
ncbi:MAG: ferric reductase-like transmembrane domain-containing protein [Deltaproteobacteria bacterium]|nr:ferric reductase-like transmembrane domain-containing protein [Deltaproteobacteria bacterium]